MQRLPHKFQRLGRLTKHVVIRNTRLSSALIQSALVYISRLPAMEAYHAAYDFTSPECTMTVALTISIDRMWSSSRLHETFCKLTRLIFLPDCIVWSSPPSPVYGHKWPLAGNWLSKFRRDALPCKIALLLYIHWLYPKPQCQDKIIIDNWPQNKPELLERKWYHWK